MMWQRCGISCPGKHIDCAQLCHNYGTTLLAVLSTEGLSDMAIFHKAFTLLALHRASSGWFMRSSPSPQQSNGIFRYPCTQVGEQITTTTNTTHGRECDVARIPCRAQILATL